MMRTIDLNADLGEGAAHDAELMAVVTSANIACGGHAGDLETMRQAVESALARQVAIGAHPGYEDPDHFGRRDLELEPTAVHDQITRQLERLLGIHPDVHHVKPHGALYNQANRDAALADTVIAAIHQLLPDTLLMVPPSGELARAAGQAGLRICGEGFIDRRYLPDGTLCPRREPGAVIHDPAAAVAQALELACNGEVTAIDGTTIPLTVDSLCVHGDTPQAVQLAEQVRQALESAGIRIRAAV